MDRSETESGPLAAKIVLLMRLHISEFKIPSYVIFLFRLAGTSKTARLNALKKRACCL